jgi:hypothetical protein
MYLRSRAAKMQRRSLSVLVPEREFLREHWIHVSRASVYRMDGDR